MLLLVQVLLLALVFQLAGATRVLNAFDPREDKNDPRMLFFGSQEKTIFFRNFIIIKFTCLAATAT